MTHVTESRPSESELRSSNLRSTDWSQLAADIHVAARSTAPVLISGPADSAVNLARTIAAFGGVLKASDVRVRDCGGEDDVAAAMAQAQHSNGSEPNPHILLLREVHRLGAGAQAALAQLVAARHDGQFRETPRIISTSSVPLFDRVREGAFDEDLFYRLNVIHITA
jgi:hypothetical protein